MGRSRPRCTRRPSARAQAMSSGVSPITIVRSREGGPGAGALAGDRPSSSSRCSASEPNAALAGSEVVTDSGALELQSRDRLVVAGQQREPDRALARERVERVEDTRRKVRRKAARTASREGAAAGRLKLVQGSVEAPLGRARRRSRCRARSAYRFDRPRGRPASPDRRARRRATELQASPGGADRSRGAATSRQCRKAAAQRHCRDSNIRQRGSTDRPIRSKEPMRRKAFRPKGSPYPTIQTARARADCVEARL